MAVIIDRPLEFLTAVMRRMANNINLVGLEDEVQMTRRMRGGDILFEIVGEEKAALLAKKIKEVAGVSARVT